MDNTYIPTTSVRNFTVESTSPTTAALTWNSPSSGLITHYLINITNRDTEVTESVRHIAGHLSSTTIDSLHPNHRYRFSIAAFTSALGPYVFQETHQPQDGKVLVATYNYRSTKVLYTITL